VCSPRGGSCDKGVNLVEQQPAPIEHRADPADRGADLGVGDVQMEGRPAVKRLLQVYSALRNVGEGCE
jgi:hypothetical protein